MIAAGPRVAGGNRSAGVADVRIDGIGVGSEALHPNHIAPVAAIPSVPSNSVAGNVRFH